MRANPVVPYLHPKPQTPALYLLFVPPRDGSLAGVNFSLTPRSCHLTPRFHEAFGAVLSPALFLFAGRKSASATWTAVRGSGADTAATRYSGRGQPPPTPSQQQQTRKFHLFYPPASSDLRPSHLPPFFFFSPLPGRTTCSPARVPSAWRKPTTPTRRRTRRRKAKGRRTTPSWRTR